MCMQSKGKINLLKYNSVCRLETININIIHAYQFIYSKRLLRKILRFFYLNKEEEAKSNFLKDMGTSFRDF